MLHKHSFYFLSFQKAQVCQALREVRTSLVSPSPKPMHLSLVIQCTGPMLLLGAPGSGLFAQEGSPVPLSRLRWGRRLCISDKSPGDAKTAGPWTWL